MRTRFRFLGVVLFAGLAATARPSDRPVNEIPYELPAYTITEGRELPPPEAWLYAQVSGFEVLSNATESVTRDTLTQFQRFRFAIDLVWPGVQQPEALPPLLVLCGAGRQFQLFVPDSDKGGAAATTALVLRDRTSAALVVDFQSKSVNLSEIEGVEATVVRDWMPPPDSPNAADPALDGLAGPVVTEVDVDPYQELYRAYLRLMLARAEPRLPPWFEEGLIQILVNLDVTAQTVVVGKVGDPNEAGATGFMTYFSNRRLYKMQSFFDTRHPPGREPHLADRVWSMQAYAFVHWGLYGEGKRHQKGFLRLVQRASSEPMTPALVEACLGTTMDQLGIDLRAYCDWARYVAAGVKSEKGEVLPLPQPVEIRPATDSEVGRIKGTALALAGRGEDAKLTLIRPYLRGERDARLLGALGLFEQAAGEKARARKFLEAAAKKKVEDARALVELSRLRLEEALGAAPEGLLDAPSMGPILEPLLAARNVPPPLAEAYGLMARAWSLSRTPPSPRQLDFVLEGASRFPRHMALVHEAAQLSLRCGRMDAAEALVDHGLRFSPSAEARARFEALKLRLPARKS